jgi:glycerate 2-kinase
MHVVVAPDKLKGSLTAEQAAAAIEAGLRRVVPGLDVRRCPVADGGDGTVAAAVSRGWQPRTATVSGPFGDPVQATWAQQAETALVELAEASGLRQAGGRLDALRATSRGTGDLVRAALDAGCHEVVIGLGGSACTDGGSGMLAALGARVLDGEGRPLPDGGGPLAGVARLDLTELDARLRATRVVVATDVDVPLLGPSGAAQSFGPQKGATAHDVELLEAALGRWGEVTARACGLDPAEALNRPGAGAAGGVGFAALTVLGAQRRSGVEEVLELVGFDDLVRGAALVVTAEGSLDDQSLHGKAPVGVASAAAGAGVPVVAVVGRCLITEEQARAAGLSEVRPLGGPGADVATLMAQAGLLVEQAAEELGRRWLPQP